MLRRTTPVLLVLLVIATAAVASSATVGNACFNPILDGIEYDLTSLSGVTFSGEQNRPDLGITFGFTMGVCVNDVPCPLFGAGICQKNLHGEDAHKIGDWSVDWGQPAWEFSDPSKPGRGIVGKFTNGDTDEVCTRQANVHFICGKDSPNLEIVEGNPCVFHLTLHTEAVCKNGEDGSGGSGSGGSDGLSNGSILLIVCLVAVVLYVGLGCVYKTRRTGTSGFESCPNVNFWRSLPSLVRDGCRFSYTKVTGKAAGGGEHYDEL